MNLGPRGPRAFLDTNVLVYADEANEPFKQTRAVALIEEPLRLRSGVVSIQVLQEYFAAALKKTHLEPALAKRKIARSRPNSQTITREDHSTIGASQREGKKRRPHKT